MLQNLFSKNYSLNTIWLFTLPLLFALWWFCLSVLGNVTELFQSHGIFFALGIFGAITANATGAGGGVVFVPAFDILGLDAAQIIATSFAIQCFGMTMGSFSWVRKLQKAENPKRNISIIGKILLSAVPASLVGLWLVQYAEIPPLGDLQTKFSVFSVVLGAVLLLQVLVFNRHIANSNRHNLDTTDHMAIIASCFIGGMITAWLSVGVGEILAVLLLLLKFPISIAVAAAVCISSISVLAGVPLHFFANHIVWEVLVFAAPAALIGGFVASSIALKLGSKRLKIALSVWILFIGLVHFL